MHRLFCPLFYWRLALNIERAVELFIRHDDTLLRVESLLQKSQDDANRASTNAAGILKEDRNA